MLINHNNGTKLLDDKYKSIASSEIYKAMAQDGIETFTHEILEEVEDGLLNETEVYYITLYNCVSPNGYNLTNGGGSKYKHATESIDLMKKVKRENINGVRNPLIHDMPPLFTYDTKLDAIILQKHPLCEFRGFYIRTHGSLAAAKEAALKFVEELEKLGQKHVRTKKINSPVRGVYEKVAGSGNYYVSKRVNKVTHNRAFSSESAEENLRRAIEFVNSLQK
jgi:hypothetical protein